MSKIVLDPGAFKALASDTRLQILKGLDVRRLTVSELGRLLSLNKATVFEHLKQLAAAGLVTKEDEGRKWIYYRLTWKGRNVLHPENVQIFIMLGLAALGGAGSVLALGRSLGWWFREALPAADENAPAFQPESAEDAAAPAPGDEASAGSEGFWGDPSSWIFIGLAVAAIVVLVVGGILWRRRLAERRDVRSRLETLRVSG